jgi:hypothetical protein
MAASAPRYDPRLLAAIRRLDDKSEPIAQTCRRVGDAADSLGLPRPSYVHVRRIVKAERLRAEETAGLVGDLIGDALAGRAPRLGPAVERSREAGGRARLRRSSG